MTKPTSPPHLFNIEATVLEGTIRLSGDIAGCAIEVPKHATAKVVIADTEKWHLYAAESPSKGCTASCWTRGATTVEQTFERVHAEVHNIVYAVAKSNAKSVTYGPVITVKPKG